MLKLPLFGQARHARRSMAPPGDKRSMRENRKIGPNGCAPLLSLERGPPSQVPFGYYLHRLNFLSTMGDQAACMSPSSHILSSLDMKYPPGCISKRVAKIQQCVEARGPSVASMAELGWKAWVPRGTGSHGPDNSQRPKARRGPRPAEAAEAAIARPEPS